MPFDTTAHSLDKPICVLVFPPVWEAAAPYLAGPALAAYLRQSGHVAHLIDANNIFWNHFRREPELYARIYQRCVDSCNDLSLSLEEGAVANQTAEQPFDQFAEWLNRVSIASPRYELLVRTFGGFRNLPPRPVDESLRYHDHYFGDISQSYVATNSSALYERVTSDATNPWRIFAKKYILPGLASHDAAMLGITIAAPNQVVPAFALAIEARLTRPTLSIVFGGPWVTHLRERIQNIEWFSEWRFLFVPFQGETTLADMLTALYEKRDPAPIALRAIAAPQPLCRLPFKTLPAPDFTGLPLGDYAEPGHLSLMASRGCYWSKCTFCSYPVLEPKYERRDLDEIESSIRQLIERFHAHYIPFTDPSMSMPLARNIAAIIRRNGWNVKWGAFARFEEGFTADVLNELANGGCAVLHWGLESGSLRILQELNKGIDLFIAARILQGAATAGIHSRLLMMYGFPNETESDVDASIAFVENNIDVIGSVCWSRCTVELDTGLAGVAASNNQVINDNDLALGSVVIPPYGANKLAALEKQMDFISAHMVATINEQMIHSY